MLSQKTVSQLVLSRKSNHKIKYGFVLLQQVSCHIYIGANSFIYCICIQNRKKEKKMYFVFHHWFYRLNCRDPMDISWIVYFCMSNNRVNDTDLTTSPGLNYILCVICYGCVWERIMSNDYNISNNYALTDREATQFEAPILMQVFSALCICLWQYGV